MLASMGINVDTMIFFSNYVRDRVSSAPFPSSPILLSTVDHLDNFTEILFTLYAHSMEFIKFTFLLLQGDNH